MALAMSWQVLRRMLWHARYYQPGAAQVALVTAPATGPGEGAAQLARLNLSRDAAYAGRARRKGERVAGALAKHATPAASLLTLPIKCARSALLALALCILPESIAGRISAWFACCCDPSAGCQPGLSMRARAQDKLLFSTRHKGVLRAGSSVGWL